MSRLNLNLDAATRTRSGCVPRSPARPLTPLSTQLQVWHTALRCTRFLETVVECCDLAVRVVSACCLLLNKKSARSWLSDENSAFRTILATGTAAVPLERSRHILYGQYFISTHCRIDETV